MIILYIVLGVVCLLFLIFLLITRHNFRKIRKMFRRGSVSVCGLRGRGKDMLIANVIARDNRPYISNVDYRVKGNTWIPLDMSFLDVKNNYRNFIYGNVVPFKYGYPEDVDIYISDTGIYFPSQYNGELNKEFRQFPVFLALSRQIGHCNVHTNTQALNRPWDKVREQSDIYIRCESCRYSGNVRLFKRSRLLGRLFGRFVFQRVTVYTQFQAAADAVKPYVHIKVPFSISAKVRAEYKARDRAAYRKFVEDHGEVRRYFLLYQNKSRYDTRVFKSILEGSHD